MKKIFDKFEGRNLRELVEGEIVNCQIMINYWREFDANLAECYIEKEYFLNTLLNKVNSVSEEGSYAQSRRQG